ncbi:MAG: glycerol-3-phosphate acyltransferase, partial [Gammaproteobacteria bacterium]|nr:glycerol-3-phosphate acyltransferase [Gammaproteobacteria bacterium]
MAINPWQEIDSDSALFIIDADHRIEEKLLQDWIDTNKAKSSFSGNADSVIVPIARDPENIPTDNLQARLEIADTTVVVPVRVVWKTSLDRMGNKPRFRDLLLGNPRRPNQSKAQRILENDAACAVCIAGKPATLGDLKQRFLARQENALVDKDLGEYIAGQAGLALEVAERRLRGSRYKVPRGVAKQIRASNRFKRGLLDLARETGATEAQLREKALPIFKELVSTPHNFWQDVMASFLRKIISLGYENELVFDQERLIRFRQIVREHPTALLWTHKTHMDGLTMQAILFENDFPTPHTIGGINMAFAGLGFLARRSGAIFIRRSFQDDPLYKLVLRNYLAYLLEKRFPLSWSFEGTRSRVGKLMPPRFGILKYVMEAMAESTADELHIIPIAINYDMINDVKDYAAEQSGGIKRPESLSWFVSYLRRLRQPLGRIYVDFGEPVVVDKAALSNDSLALARTAFKVGVEANRVTPITLTSLMAMSLLGAAPRAQTFRELRDGTNGLRKWAAHRDIRFTSDFDDDNVKHMLNLVDAMVANELINRYDEGPETVYAVAADQHPLASYYRNTIVHHFVSKAIAELALLHAGVHPEDPVTEFWSEANR